MDSEAGPVENTPKKTQGRGGLALAVAILVLMVVTAAYFQEEIGYFVQLQAWNSGKPRQTVVNFLEAGRAGKQSEADGAIDVNLYHPLQENGKFVGYEMGTPMGSLEFRFDDLAGSGGLQATASEFVFKGNGAAMVTVPDAAGKPIVYRLEMRGGDWKITEIRAGKLRK